MPPTVAKDIVFIAELVAGLTNLQSGSFDVKGFVFPVSEIW